MSTAGQQILQAAVEHFWSQPRWINDELIMEEARRRERAGEGTVIEDGQPPARWVPKESE